MNTTISTKQNHTFALRSLNSKWLAYWFATSVIAFVMLSGGYGEVTHQWGTMETVTILGYPAYFLTILASGRFWVPSPS